ncbi:hypothetical protein [Balneatrix alpica]|uniref:Uncharacterized protein n=1 Tax=Balneatrix alpica TaxID=75684 RepID=A0ABV5ZAN5_9GAMM|nr:hypothetical protein [Balneatrix alpica]
MPIDNNRLLLELEKHRRDLNRAIINPQIPELSLDDLAPLLKLIARARAAYVKELFDIAALAGDELPSREQIAQLKIQRETFDELVAAMNALETCIQRDYLDVKTKR